MLDTIFRRLDAIQLHGDRIQDNKSMVGDECFMYVCISQVFVWLLLVLLFMATTPLAMLCVLHFEFNIPMLIWLWCACCVLK